ncbi:threonine--tRNA ligase [Micromonospora sp. HUAS LYJ1]|uniref:threonine--tRNA ligase n=1 Tax=Micromonospora sp. HUAS LYJ1 TaxID=3061626 RepID=UPI002672691B|nr:threonine--tRNA ligase [Micromonospora sp. HUAS LYJ1]WKU04144.1 threonine--tRNA ligase [Micromonospora sp. HUAS LYJ1]
MIDHRRLGRELDLFVSDPLAGAGLPIWLPAGAAARHAVEEYVRELERRAGYQHVYSPPLGRRELFALSGHLGHFADEMFPPMRLGDDELLLRPALCPHHALVYRARGRSYRELPLRVGELGGMYRAERSGVLGGLARVRAISLNDAHNFCTLDQVGDEVREILRLIRQAHAALGVRPAGFRLSLRGPGARYVGDDASWARAEELLRAALDGVDHVEAPGEAAFYGPKIDIQVVDAAGRESTISTVQLDFDKPEKFDLSYTDAAGAQQRPVLVHRSLVGSMERLFAYLIEAHQGAFPPWYAPVQLLLLPVDAGQADAVDRLARRAVDAGLRVAVDAGGSLGSRVRDATHRRVPYVGVVGAREAADDTVALRLRDGRSLDPMPAADAVRLIGAVVAARSAELLPAD